MGIFPSDARHTRADVNIEIADGLVDTGLKPEGDIATAGGIATEREITHSCVAAASTAAAGIVYERRITKGVVAGPPWVRRERKSAYGIVKVSGHVRKKRVPADGIIAIAVDVAEKGRITDGRVVDASSIRKQRERPISRVAVAGGVV